MKKLLRYLSIIVLFSFISIIAANAQQLQYQWANGISGTGSCSVRKVVADNQGNIYTAGSLTGTVDFNPGSGTANLDATNGGYFVAKYDAQGNYIFAFQLEYFIGDIVIDNDGNIRISGSFSSVFDVDGGVGVTNLTALGASDGYVAKYDGNGNFISAFSVGGIGPVGVEAIIVDANNNLYIAGDFEGTVDFDLGSGTTNVTTTDDNVYLAKYASNGDLVFAFGLSGTTAFYDMVADSDGNIIVSGGYNGNCDLDPSSGNANFYSGSNGDLDGFWAKYTPAGSYIKGFVYEGIAKRIAIDDNDNFYIGGLIPNNTMDVDLGPAVQTLYTEENYDIFLVKYAANDSLVYARSFECSGMYDIEGITVDAQGNAYIYGDMPDTANFNPGFTGGELISVGLFDGFIASYDADGDFIMAENIGDVNQDLVWCIAVSGGSVWLTGKFDGSSDFNFESPVNMLSSGANSGGFIAKYHNPLFTSITENTELPVEIYGAESKVFVDFSALAKVNAQVQVLNIMGQTVFETTHNQNNKLQIALPQTTGGIYFVRIINEGKILAKKLWVK